MNPAPAAPHRPHLAIDQATMDQIHDIFDELIAFLGDRWLTVNVYASKDAAGGGTNCGISCTDAAGNSLQYSERIVGPRVTIQPATANLGAGATQQFTATVKDATGADVPAPVITWKVNPGPNGGGAIDAAGLYTAPASITVAGSDTVIAAYEAGGSSAAVTVQLHT